MVSARSLDGQDGDVGLMEQREIAHDLGVVERES